MTAPDKQELDEIRTYPESIWLQRDFDNDEEGLEFNPLKHEITWDRNGIHETDVKYIRSDLARPKPSSSEADFDKYWAESRHNEKHATGSYTPRHAEFCKEAAREAFKAVHPQTTDNNPKSTTN